ncbi:MAG: two-component regulator propeller domain-containing protein [Ignavibacteriaceae bacterium]
MKIIQSTFAVVIIFLFFSCENEVTSPIINSINVSGHILPGYYITSISFDSKGTAWIGTFRQGLIKYDGNTTIFNSAGSELPDSIVIWDVATDKNDNVWLGTDSGLIKYDGQKFSFYNTSNSPLPLNLVWSIAVDYDNTLWLASCRFREGGLVKFNNNGWTVYTPDNSLLPSSSVRDIAVDRNNNIWMAVSETINGGNIVKLSGKEWNIFSGQEIGFNPYYFDELVVSDNGYIYASIDYSLSSFYDLNRPHIISFDSRKWEIRNPVDEVGNPLGFAGPICTDHYGNLWAGLWRDNVRIAVYNNGKWIYNGSDFHNVSLTELQCDRSNKIWVGTTDGIYFIK